MRKVILILLVISAWSNVLLAEQLPLDYFIKHGDYLDLKLSPDGKHMAARVRHDSQVYLAFIDSQSNKVVGGVRPGNKNEIHSVSWVSNKRVIYEFSEKRFYTDKPISTGELYAVNIDQSQHTLLYGYRAGDSKLGSRISNKEDIKATQEFLNVLANDKKHILVVEYLWSKRGNYWYDDRVKHPIISKLNVFTGKKKKLESIPYPGAKVIADSDGEVRFVSWVDKKSNLRAAYRKEPKDNWKQLDSSFSINRGLKPVSINKDSTKAYLLGPYGSEEIITLYELNLASGALTVLFDNLSSDIIDWAVDRLTLEPVVAITNEDKVNYHYRNIKSETIKQYKLLVKAFKGQWVRITSRTKDNALNLVKVASDINPGEYYLYDTKKRNVDFFWANSSWIDPRLMRNMKSISLTARDGVSIPGYITLPEHGENSGKLPLVVNIHGGPHGIRDTWEFNPEVQLLANRGYAVLQVNYRGSGGYGRKFQAMGYRQWGGKMINDIIDATQWVLANYDIDKNKICIYGASYGGYAALMSVVRAPDLFKCTVGYVGVYDLSYMYSKGDIPDLWGGVGYLERAIGRNPDKLQEYSPSYHADNINVPVMLIHGGNDRRVPIAHAKLMRKKLEALGKEVTWLEYGLSGHGVYDINDRRELYSGLLKFLHEHIGRKQ